MSNLKDKPDTINWVAIDIGKHAHMVLVENAQGKQSKFKIMNCGEDYDKFVAFLRNLPGKTKIALEPTGNFHRTLGHRLLDEG